MATSTSEILSTELGKEFLAIKQQEDRVKQFYRTNEIGQPEAIEWNSFKLKAKNPYAEAIAKAYDRMIDETIPKDAVLSTRFTNWIVSEKNNLMVDSKINRDDYFKERMDFETGIVTENRGNDLVKAKIDYLQKRLDILSKSFQTHMNNNAEVAFAQQEELGKWQSYYQKQNEKVEAVLKSGDFKSYNRTDKDGNIVKFGSETDAKTHQENLANCIARIDNAQKALDASKSGETQNVVDYVGDKFETSKIRKNH